MRWRDEPEPKWGDYREQSAFLLFPYTIGGETRWLEKGVWEERFVNFPEGHWEAVRWTS